MEFLTTDVAHLINASGASSTLLIGHDWGGSIAWLFALEAVRPVERLIVMNAPHPLLLLKGLRTWRQIRKSWYAFFFQFPKLPEFLLGRREASGIGDVFYNWGANKSGVPDEVLAAYRENARQPGALSAMINYYRANLFRFDVRIISKQLRVMKSILENPTMMIWGEEDGALGKELTYGTEKLVMDFTIRYLPDVSHWVQQEAPETVNAMIDAWLSGKEVPKARPGRKLVSAAESETAV